MMSGPVEFTLQGIEKQFEDLSAALVSGDPVALEAAASALRQAGIDLTAILQKLTPQELQDPQIAKRLKTIAEGLGERRASLMRQSALVDRKLKTVLPNAQVHTYGKTPGPLKRFSS